MLEQKQNLYESDFFEWTQKQAELLRHINDPQLDIENLAEEIESLGRSDKRALESHLKILLQHMLKNTFAEEKKGNSKSWEKTVENSRKRILKLIKESPSLKNELKIFLNSCYEEAREDATNEMDFTYTDKDRFPTECPWTFEEILNKGE